ncbi:hypothetical protein H2200_004731 [Cladophialophora chaetospira]|uniref:Uncharacterized protein n=1 Tax=Cladophialophora chaetospira TaxID=386627 RepID=A0AA38XDQ6_9EURO|nr:hypothetical protein H2200_004731 [Cladophialophora chaetospira]
MADYQKFEPPAGPPPSSALQAPPPVHQDAGPYDSSRGFQNYPQDPSGGYGPPQGWNGPPDQQPYGYGPPGPQQGMYYQQGPPVGKMATTMLLTSTPIDCRNQKPNLLSLQSTTPPITTEIQNTMPPHLSSNRGSLSFSRGILAVPPGYQLRLFGLTLLITLPVLTAGFVFFLLGQEKKPTDQIPYGTRAHFRAANCYTSDDLLLAELCMLFGVLATELGLWAVWTVLKRRESLSREF